MSEQGYLQAHPLLISLHRASGVITLIFRSEIRFCSNQGNENRGLLKPECTNAHSNE